jgi:hypothetical protein
VTWRLVFDLSLTLGVVAAIIGVCEIAGRR